MPFAAYLFYKWAETSKYVARELDGALEYLEDPTRSIEGMAAVARE